MEHLSLRDTRVRVALAVVGGLFFLWVVWASVLAWVRLDPVEDVSPETRKWVVSCLRAAVDSRPLPRPPKKGKVAKDLKRRFPGPVFVALYLRGRVVFRYVSKPKLPLGKAIQNAAHEMLATDSLQKLTDEDRRQSRIKVDITSAQGPLLTKPHILFALSVVPGVDGLGLRRGARVVYLAPDELLRRNLVTGFRPFEFVKEFKAGLHVDTVAKIFALRSGAKIPAKGELPPGEVFRFRTHGFVEAPFKVSKAEEGKGQGSGGRKAPLPVFRGSTPAPPFNRRTAVKTLVNGGNYILRMLAKKKETVQSKVHVAADGKRKYLTELELFPGEKILQRKGRVLRGQFRYIYYPLTDNMRVGGYSLPRHAGTTHALALLAGMLKGNPHVSAKQVKRFRDGAVLAIEYLAERVKRGKCKGPGYRCVSLGPVTDLGSTALPVVAVMEYTRQTGDRRFLPLGREMANFLVYMLEEDPAKPTGEFCHIYHVRNKERGCKKRLLYYSGEAALALAMAHNVLGDKAYLDAAKKALDYQTGPYLAPLTMKFLYGEDHWTAMAVDEIWPHAKDDAYADFAYGFARYQQRQQFAPGETPYDDYVGGYGITPFFPPHLTPAGSRTEAAVSAYRLSQKRGEPRHAIKTQCVRAFKYIHTHQVRWDNAYMFVNPALSHGAIRKSPVKFDVRIDYVQHTMAAMVRGLDMVPE